MQVTVMSRDEVESYVPKDGEICISIISVDPFYPSQFGDSDREVNLSDKFEDVLRLQFDDVDPNYLPSDQIHWKPLTKEQADSVNKFVQMHVTNKKRLIVHCWGGISRSRSMASAIVEKYKLGTPFQVYNKWVYDLVMM